MESNILDLRAERCPMALLLAKRYANALKPGESARILVTEPQSMRDITQYLQGADYLCQCDTQSECFSLQVTKELR